MLATNGNFYGVNSDGGADGEGVVFQDHTKRDINDIPRLGRS